MMEINDDRRDEDAAVELLRLAGPRPSVAHDRQARVRAVVRAHWERRTAHRRLSRWLWLGAVAAAAAVVTFVVVIPRLGPEAGSSVQARVERIVGEETGGRAGVTRLAVGATVVSGTWVETGDETRVAFALAEGGSLRMDGTTRLRFDDSRRVWLERGAVYYDSGDAAGVTSITVAGVPGEVVDIGTRFQVRAGQGALEVWVREGRVAVRAEELAGEIGAGRRGRLTELGELVVEEGSTAGPEWAWTMEAAPEFRIEGKSASDLLRWVERETGLELAWQEPELAAEAEHMVLHGGVTGVRPDRAAALVLPTCGLEAERVGNTLRVRRITP